jgi:hypothetical protein
LDIHKKEVGYLYLTSFFNWCLGPNLNLAIFNLPIYGPEAVDIESQETYEGDLSLYTGFKHPNLSLLILYSS